MDEFNRYELLMEALAELKPEIDAAYPTSSVENTQPTQSLPPLGEVLNEFGPMPPEALFLGLASDGLPVLLNLHDPVPGPILISSDAGTGKTILLQTLALAAGLMHQPEQLQFGALTSHPDEWNGMEGISNNVGIFPIYHQAAEDFILSLASWAHGNKSSRQSILLLAILAQDVTKSDSDRDLYNSEFSKLASYIDNVATKDFNGVSLFSCTSLNVTIDSDGNTFSMSGIDLAASAYTTATSGDVSTTSAAATALTDVKSAIAQLATDRATVGANPTRLNFTSEQLDVLKENLQAATSRIKDVNVADESTQYASYNILVQAGTAMLAQANAVPQSMFRLLQ